MKLFKLLAIAFITLITAGAATAQQVVVRARVGPGHHRVYHHHYRHHHYHHRR